MTEPEAPPAAGGQRTLAAIVFTDALNFSGRMTEDEPAALRAVRRDIAVMTEVCRRFDGRVVKNTGDGLMMLFTSAVQAVHCAIEIQRQLSDAARMHPAADGFEHRIGVHLGDVVLTDGDALGDGVNVAARLQEHAEPGGICLSQTVFQVVRSSLSVPVEGPERLELKNVETVQALRIGPGAITGRVTARSRARTASSRGHLWIALGIVLLAAAIAYVGYSLNDALKRVSPAASPDASGETNRSAAPAVDQAGSGTPVSGAAPATLSPPPATNPRAATSAPPPASPPPAGPPPASTSSERPPVNSETTPPAATSAAPPRAGDVATGRVPAGTRPAAGSEGEFEKRRLQARSTYEFGAFADWLAQTSNGADAGRNRLVQRYRLLDQMMSWVKSTVATATIEQPLMVPLNASSGSEFGKVWGDNGRVVMANTRGNRTADWRELAPREVGTIAFAVGRDAPPSRAEAQRRRTWVVMFAEEYGLQIPRPPPSRQ